MHSNSLLNHHIGVFLCSLETIILSIQLVEAHLDTGATGDFGADGTTSRIRLNLSSSIVFTLDLVLVSLHELSDHVPEKMHLLIFSVWERWAQIVKFTFGLLALISDFLDNLGQVMLDVSE